jgi:hypothetical protein
LAIGGPGGHKKLSRVRADTREAALHVLGEACCESVAFVGLDADHGKLEGAEPGRTVFRPYALAEPGDDCLLHSSPQLDAAQAGPGDLEQDEGEWKLMSGSTRELGLERGVEAFGVQEGDFVVLVGSGHDLPFVSPSRPDPGRPAALVHRQSCDLAQGWAPAPSLEASLLAFMCAIASIEIIGFTPEAVGKTEPSHT